MLGSGYGTPLGLRARVIRVMGLVQSYFYGLRVLTPLSRRLTRRLGGEANTQQAMDGGEIGDLCVSAR